MKKILLFIFLFVFINTDETFSNSTKIQDNFNTQISSFKLPKELILCGEKLPLDIPEVKERAEREFYFLLQQPGQIILYLKRAGRLFPMYEKKLKQAGMPDDLKYLSVAESALRQARSSKSAVGLWQFMKGTGRKMGLQVDKYVDERKHPEKSTRAALKYLKHGHKLHGSWMLTLAGYNMGHTGVKRTRGFQFGDDYFDLFLNEETSRFIFRIAIIKELMSNSERYGFKLSNDQLYKQYKTQTIIQKSAIKNLSQWAKVNGTTYKEVKILNPWILKRTLPRPKANKPYKIYIPK